MSRIAESEMILNARGAIYHLNLKPDEIGNTVFLVGDPDRVKEVSKHFDKIEYKGEYREFITHTGLIGKKRLSVLSTGIGTDNIDIAINELDALANIDFTTREIKPTPSYLNLIRIGTSGALQPEISVDSLIASTHGLGIDNLLNFYRLEQNEEEKQLLHSFVTSTQMHSRIGYPYIAGASASLIKHFVNDFFQGITVTCPGFYGPQGRILRLGISNPELIDRLTQFRFGQHRITNFEMETSAIYGLSKLLGHNCLSLNAVIANRVRKEFSKDGKAAVEKLIIKVLEIVSENV
jgi:uridine phosphorylase